MTFFIARKNNKIVGAAGQGYSLNAYCGKITLMVGMQPTGKIITVIVTEDNETPRIGGKVTRRIKNNNSNNLGSNKILDAFNGHIAKRNTPWSVKIDGGEFDFITGATITSRAVTEAVYTINHTFLEHMNEIIHKN